MKLRSIYLTGSLSGRCVVIMGGIIVAAIAAIKMAQLAYGSAHGLPLKSSGEKETASTLPQPYHAPNNGFTGWEKLSVDLIQVIFAKVDDTALRIKARRTCKQWYKALNRPCAILPELIDLHAIPEIRALPQSASRSLVYRSLVTLVDLVGGWGAFDDIEEWNQAESTWPTRHEEVESTVYETVYEYVGPPVCHPPLRNLPWDRRMSFPTRPKIRITRPKRVVRKTVVRKAELSEMQGREFPPRCYGRTPEVARGMTLKGGLYVLSKHLNKSTSAWGRGIGYITISPHGQLCLFVDGYTVHPSDQRWPETCQLVRERLKPLLSN